MKDVLIYLVFNVPAVWDKGHRQHHNRHVLAKEWKKIATQLGVTETEARNCWKNLRQEFGKQLRKLGDAAPNETESQWPFFQKLLFLTDQFTPRETSGNLTDIPDDPCNNVADSDSEGSVHSDEAKFIPPTPLSIHNVTSLSPDCDHTVQNPTPTTSSPRDGQSSSYTITKTGYKKRITPPSEIGKQLLELEKEKLALRKSKSPYDHYDEDVGFFNSLLPHVKALSPKDQMIFRMKAQQTLFELAFPQQTSPKTSVAAAQPSSERN